MKIAIVVGHNARAQGAVRITDGQPEFQWNSHLAELIQDIDPACVKVFFRVRGGGYSREIDRVYKEVDTWGADCSIELHFNGSPDPRAEGCLTLTSGTVGSRALAKEVHNRMLAVMGNEDDGIRARGRGDRGGRSLWAGRAPAIMTEPYFGGNARFCHVADARKDELAEAIYEGAKAFCLA
ncbi:MAG: N-acetylmuramoyl-L-alanine amidase [Pseudomonadota bacterium]